MAPVWFITGSSTGFGRKMTEYILGKGGIVVATLRKPEALADLQAQYTKDQLLVIRLDVTKPQEISQAFEQAKAAFGRINIVFNNAGYAIVGEVEACPEDEARKLFDTNYWGAVNVSIEAIKFFREVNGPEVGGWLLQNCSMWGLEGGAICSTYVATKHALEGLTKSLVQELDPAWNIKITSLVAGFFQTELARNAPAMPIPAAYTSDLSSGTRQLLAAGDLPGDINKAIEVIYKLSESPERPLHFPLGLDAIKIMTRVGQYYLETAEKFKSWSDDVLKDELGDMARIIKDTYA